MSFSLPNNKASGRSALLPLGLRDSLSPEARRRADITARLIKSFERFGYERVEPPLVEFEESLIDTCGGQLADLTFRIMDPLSHRMMGVRADITGQIARIAATRLVDEPRPLRLCYTGEVLHTHSSQLRSERQLTQTGLELFGASSITADIEIVRLVAAALQETGISNLSIDVNAAPLIDKLNRIYEFAPEQTLQLRQAIDRKDKQAITNLAGPAAAVYGGLMAVTGPARAALMVLTSLDLPTEVAPLKAELIAFTEGLIMASPGLSITVDPVENRGFEYYTGIGFTFFAKGVAGELGRGGRYQVEKTGEQAAGCSLYLESVLRAAPSELSSKRVYLPYGTERDVAVGLHYMDFITISGLEPVPDNDAEAQRLKCGYIFYDGTLYTIFSDGTKKEIDKGEFD